MIVDGRTQMPVQDATVTVAQGAGPRADIIAHVTNAEGVVEFDGLMAGYWVFQALGPDGQTGRAGLAVGETETLSVRISHGY